MKKNKSLTVTYHRSLNFGASLQAYALQQTLLSSNNDNKIIDFNYSHWEKICKAKSIRTFLLKLYCNFSQLIHLKKFLTRIHRFNAFTSNYLFLTKKYKTVDDITKDFNNRDLAFLLTGSDQVFSLRNSSFTNAINLLDINLPCSKYSYAASFSAYNLSSFERERFYKSLSTFERISVREMEGKKLLSDIGLNNCSVHIDPVFLLEKNEWVKILPQRIIKERYVLYYQVNSNPIANDVLKKCKSEMKLPIICVQSNFHKTVKGNKFIFDAGPLEFLSLLYYSDYIVTTSFHGTAFSCLFNKDFYVVTKKESNPFRILELLKKFHLEDRLIDSIEEINFFNKVEWSFVNKQIANFRYEGKNYLNEIISHCGE